MSQKDQGVLYWPVMKSDLKSFIQQLDIFNSHQVGQQDEPIMSQPHFSSIQNSMNC